MQSNVVAVNIEEIVKSVVRLNASFRNFIETRQLYSLYTFQCINNFLQMQPNDYFDEGDYSKFAEYSNNMLAQITASLELAIIDISKLLVEKQIGLWPISPILSIYDLKQHLLLKLPLKIALCDMIKHENRCISFTSISEDVLKKINNMYYENLFTHGENETGNST